MSNQVLMVTGDLHVITNGLKNGKGSLDALITDTVLSTKIKQVIGKFEKISDTAAIISEDLSIIVNNIKQGKESLGILLSYPLFVHNLNNSIIKIDSAVRSFDENMKAVHLSWVF